MLTYGYIDCEAGLTMEVLCAGYKDGDSFTFFESSEETRVMLRVGSVEENEFYLFDDSDGGLSKKYAEKLEILTNYEASDEVEESRNMTFLDKLRHDEYSIGGEGICCIIKEDGRAVDLTTYYDNYAKRGECKEFDVK